MMRGYLNRYGMVALFLSTLVAGCAGDEKARKPRACETTGTCAPAVGDWIAPATSSHELKSKNYRATLTLGPPIAGSAKSPRHRAELGVTPNRSGGAR